MTTKIDLVRLADAEKKPLKYDKQPMSDDDCKSSSRSTRHVSTSSSGSLLPVLLVIVVSASLMFYYVYRLETRVRLLELTYGTRSGSPTIDVVFPETPVTSSSSSSSSSSSTPDPTAAATSTTPPSFVDDEILQSGVDVETEYVDDYGSGAMDLDFDAESVDPFYDPYDDATLGGTTASDTLENPEGSGDGLLDTESLSSDLQTSGFWKSYLNSFNSRRLELGLEESETANGVYTRSRRSVDSQPGDAVQDESHDNNDNNDVMMADDASSLGPNADTRRGARDQVRPDSTGSRPGNVGGGQESRSKTSPQSRMKNRANDRSSSKTTTNRKTTRPTNEIKVAQFVAPRQSRTYTTDVMPPVTLPFWLADNMTMALGSQNWFFDLSDGKVTILESGVYFIYAQIVYHDASGRWAFGIYVDDSERIKCMNSEQLQRHHSGQAPTAGNAAGAVHSIYQHCYTSGLLKLRRYEKISLRCLYGNKAIIMQPGFTFWGLVKLVSTDD